ncbi:MAG: transposase [Bacteroidota bacterium]
MRQEELDDLPNKVLEQFKSSKSLLGKGGAFAAMLKQFLEPALNSEMEGHSGPHER